MKPHMKWSDWRRYAARIGIVALLTTTGAVAVAGPAHAAAGCTVTYGVRPQPPQFMGTVDITNLGDPITDGWTLSFDFPAAQRIINGWPVTWAQAPGSNHVTATSNAPWNHSLPTGARFQAAFLATFVGINPPPARFLLNGTVCNGGTPQVRTVTSPTPGRVFPAGAATVPFRVA